MLNTARIFLKIINYQRTIINHYGNNEKIIIRPYDMKFNSLCNQENLFGQYKNLNISEKVIKFLFDSCNKRFKISFKDKYRFRGYHEQLSVNDCYTVMKQKYEFIAHFDLDEMIFPRNFTNTEDFYEKSEYFTCNNVSKICNANVFTNSYNQVKSSVGIKDNYLYNYIMSLVNDKLLNGFKLNEMSSIFFRDSPYLIPDVDEKKLINQLGTFLGDLNNNHKFPYKLTLSASPYEKGHTFIIEREDISYVQYLYDSYSKFISCAYENYLNKTNKVDKNLVRYFYYAAERGERQFKVIHYYRNVYSI